MKMLLMPPYFFPETMASSHLDNDRFLAYSHRGINTVVYAPWPTRGVTEEQIIHTQKKENMFDNTVEITRFNMFRERKNPLLRALRYILVNLKQYYYGSGSSNIDVIYSGSTPPTQGLLCGLVKKKLSKKYKSYVPYILCLQDIFPDSLVNAKMTKKGSLLWKIGRIIENYTYRSADKIIVISEDFKKNIIAKGVSEEKIVVIPNWVNTDNVYPVNRKDNVLFERYGLDRNNFYICYSGNLGHSQNLDLLVKVAEEIRDSMPDVMFVLIGEGAVKERLEETVKERNITNIIILPFQPYEDIAHVFSLGDVGLIISKPGIGGSSVPSKTWSIMAAGRPILASFDKDSELSKILIEQKCGICVDPRSVEEFIEAITALKNDSELRMGENGRKYVNDTLNKDKCVNAYITEIKRLAGEQG